MERRATTITPSRDWAKEIVASWRKNVEGILATADIVLAARKSIGHGKWEDFVINELPFGYDTANRLCNIAECPFFRKVAQAQVLPANYTALAELARMKEDAFMEALDRGAIHPDMGRHDVIPLLPRPTRLTKPDENWRKRPILRVNAVRLAQPETDALAVAREKYFTLCEDTLGGAELERELNFAIELLLNLKAEQEPRD